MKKKVLVVIVLVGLLGVFAQAATLSYSATAPTVGAEDVYFMGESTTDRTNVAGNLDVDTLQFPTSGNDAATYIAHDRPGALGQTFTTGSNGLVMTGFWLKNVAYTSSISNGTWWYANNEGGGSHLQFRVVKPTGTALTVLSTSNYTVTGTETGNGLLPVNWSPDKLGTGTWVHFGLDAPVTLAANTQYGFDVTVTLGAWGYFFETAGVIDNQYAGGSAYRTGPASGNGQNNNSMDSVWDGDHAFVIAPEPATMILLGIGGLMLGRRR